MAGALLYAPAAPAFAQVVPPPASEVPIPVKPKTDSGPDTVAVKADTIKAPIGRFADPVLYEIGPQYEWNREQLFATGALTLVDLLDRIPGVTTFRSGWLATPQTAMHNGDFRRVRVFYDGLEIDNLDSRTGGVLDLSTVSIWSLEHLSIERSAAELRIYMRSWRTDNTSPYTRTDVATGNEDTNLYRGFYGKRFDNGGALQLAGQQYGVTSSRFAGSGDALSVLARIGVARKSWSVDGFVVRHHPDRDIQRGVNRPPVLGLDATYTDAYVRASVGSPGGPWASLTVGSLGFKGTTGPDRNVSATAFADTLERRVSEAQYDLSGGLTVGPLRVEAGDRLRALGGQTYNAARARADIVSPIGVISGFVERDGFHQTTNADVGVRLVPLPFIAFSGSVATGLPTSSGSIDSPGATAVRGEAAIRLFGPWLGGGIIRTDRTAGLAPLAYDTLLVPTPAGKLSAWTASIRGPIRGGFAIDAWVERWSPAGPYTPEYQSRGEISYFNNFLRAFPRGDFELRLAGIYEYRSHVDFPLAAGDVRTEVAKTLSTLLEIRIMRAVLSYQQRNILAWQYPIVPGFEMPRVLAIYGVRWYFWN